MSGSAFSLLPLPSGYAQVGDVHCSNEWDKLRPRVQVNGKKMNHLCC